MTPRRRLAFFGGSFDPVHTGHLHAARAARDAFRLDRIAFVPAARPPHKPGRALTGGWHRLAMLNIALEPHPDWCASDLELTRDGPSYSIDTVRELPAALGEQDAELWLVVGSDNLAGLGSWRSIEALLALARPIVVAREGDPARLPDDLRERLSPSAVARLEAGLVRSPPAPGRGTDLREALERGETDLPELPPGVEEYIRAWSLYRPPIGAPRSGDP